MSTAIPQIPLKASVPSRIPILAFGSGTAWARSKPEGSKHLLSEPLVALGVDALRTGFRHLDAAEVYKTERELGEAIRRSGVPREEIFLTTKVWGSCKDVKAAFEQSLERLGVAYVDLYLVHAPYTEEEYGVGMRGVWEGMESVYASGRARAIGVSNFKVNHLKDLLEYAKVPPAINQIEFHPFNQDPELLALHRQHGILTESYSSLVPLTRFSGVNPEFDSVLEQLADKYGQSKGQILLRWNLQMVDVVVTTSNRKERLEEYLRILEFQLKQEDVELLSEKGRGTVRRAYWTRFLGPNPE